MKKQNNRDKLNDALGMVDEELLQGVMLHAEGMREAHLSRRAVIRRRVAIVAAACLSLCMVAGAMLAVPLLTAEDPAITEPPAPHEPGHESAGATSAEDTDKEEAFYVEAPMVRLDQLSAGETSAISDPTIPTQIISASIKTKYSFNPILMLNFDCEPGETVTLRAKTSCLGLVEWEDQQLRSLYNQPSNSTDKVDTDSIERLYNYLSKLSLKSNYEKMSNTITFDPDTTSAQVELPDSHRLMAEEIIEFMIRNEQGEIVGAGSIYVGSLYDSEPSGEDVIVLDRYKITRSAVLGSVRFTNPAAMTEEKVNEVLGTFATKAEDAKVQLDFTPTTPYELRKKAIKEIGAFAYATEEHVNDVYTESASSVSEGWNYSFFQIRYAEDAPMRDFIIFKDGTWAEMEVDPHDDCPVLSCHGGEPCPLTVQFGCHHITQGCIVTLTDGRLLEFQLDENKCVTATVVYNPIE